MATEYDHDGQRVVKTRITRWNLHKSERELFELAVELENWRLADKTRRMLADLVNHLSAKMPPFEPPLDHIDRNELRRAALVSAAALAIRATGSAMILIAGGYLPESGALARRGLEAKWHARAVIDDPSGDYALRFLKGRGRGLTKLAQRYKSAEDAEILSRFANADVRGLAALHLRPPTRSGLIEQGEITILPARNDQQAALALYALAYEAVECLA